MTLNHGIKSKVAIRSLASALPANSVSNDDPRFDDLRAELPPSWWKFWGIESRPFMDREVETAITMALSASRKALELAEVQADEVELILTNLSSPVIRDGEGYRLFPRVSEDLRVQLKANNAVCWDVEMECLTFMLLLQQAAAFIRSGRYSKVLVCSVETMSEIMDFGARDSTTFGDGAAAAVVTNDDIGSDLLAASWQSNAEFYDVATVRWRQPAKGGERSIYFTLAPDGRQRMMDFVPHTVPRVVQRALADAGIRGEQVSQFIFHQPGRVLIDSWANGVSQLCGDISGRYPICVRDNGCLVSVAIPTALIQALEAQVIREGDYVVLGGLGTGWGYGAQVWRWGATRFGRVDSRDSGSERVAVAPVSHEVFKAFTARDDA